MFPLSILDTLATPVILVGGDRRVVAANQPARDILQVSMVGRDLSHALRHPAVLRVTDMVLAGGGRHETEIELPVPVPRTFTVEVSGLAEEPGNQVRAVLTFHDMTTSRRAEQMRADFVANVSHELRSPLAALIGFIETLQGPASGDPNAQKRFLGIMQREAERMSRLINDLLSLTRVEINEHIPPRDSVDLADLLGNVVEFLGPRAQDSDMVIDLTLDHADPWVIGDADELTQVFQNLVDNAVKYGSPGSSIEVRLTAVDKMPGGIRPGWSISVRDHGPGIPRDLLPRLTERFYRVDKARSRDKGGTGLGLAIVKHIINRHRGRLMIESVPDQGSTFTVMLPRAKESFLSESAH